MKNSVTVGMVSLGCAKNEVDAETMLGILHEAGYEIVADPEQADVIVVNTCGFIQSAKEESIGAILDMAEYKKQGSCRALIVSGCLSQRYSAQMEPDLPEVDAFLGIGEIDQIARVVSQTLSEKAEKHLAAKAPYRFVETPRILTGAPHSSYLKIADGCDNRCSYCAIPLIRGNAVSRPMEAVLDEAKRLIDLGAKELLPIAQDTTRYGVDLYGRPRLMELLEKLCALGGVSWIRPLYLYPDWLSRDFIRDLAQLDKVCKYLDLPIQHINDALLSKMNRRGNSRLIREILEEGRAQGFALRTTLIVGFPGETKAQFEELLAFVKEMQFDRLGAFAYSQEEDTPAAAMEGQISSGVKNSRVAKIMGAQRKISSQLLQNRVGQTAPVLIERIDARGRYVGRSQWEAPDVDGCIFVSAPKDRPLTLGEFASVRMTGALEYDLLGEVAL